MENNIEYLPSGDSALLMKFGNQIKEEINFQIRGLTYLLNQEQVEGVKEWIPSYTTIMLIYDPLVIGYQKLVSKLKKLEERSNDLLLPQPQIVKIPTLYGGEYGPDLEFVAKYNNLTPQEVIKIHSTRDYLVYMLGFTPGFPYLGGISATITTPRLNKPRKKIASGSVGIAGNQTGIYPIASPGGWQIIGRTPLNLFDPNREPSVLFEVGYYLRFIPITKKEFRKIKQRVEVGDYEVSISYK